MGNGEKRNSKSNGLTKGQNSVSQPSLSSSSSTNSASATPTTSKRSRFLEIVRQSNISCQNGDFPKSVNLYTEALKLDPNNHILYSNRSAALIKMGQFGKALQDALKARELNPKWPKAYYRQGVALQCLGKHAEALAAFSVGLSEDQRSEQLLSGLIEAARLWPAFAGKLEPTFKQLESMKLEKSGFVVTSVIGQELLAEGFYYPTVVVLESALKIGTGNVRLKGSVYSALSSAYWALNLIEKAIGFMQLDLSSNKALGDTVGECRTHGNLGAAYFSKGNYKEALTSYRYQLVLAMKCKDTVAATSALTSLGHVYIAIGDYSNALASHKQCVQLLKQMQDSLKEAREIGNVGTVFLAMGEFDKAIECHMEHLRIAGSVLGNKVEEARAYSNLGSSYHYRRDFEQAILYHNQVLKIAQDISNKSIEARAYAGLGHAARCMGDYEMARSWHEKQLDMALITKDRVCEGRACSNLGIIYQLLGDHDSALKLHQAHLNIASSLQDRAGMGRAYGNIGNAYSAMEFYEEAIKYHKEELAISKEVNDRGSEASTHGNLAVGYQALGSFDKALTHYHSHLSISRELKDGAGEACALLNLGNCHSSQGDFNSAIPFYENYLALSQELTDIEGEAKACHFLGYSHFSLGNFKEALRYYNQDLSLAKEMQNKESIAKSYCNLGLTHLSLGNLESALECARFFLGAAQSSGSIQSKFRALGVLGNVFLKMNKTDEAIKIYQKQVIYAKANSNRVMEGAGYGALGSAFKTLKQYDKAIHFHSLELDILREARDPRGECKAQGNLAAVYMAIRNYKSAVKCYENMLSIALKLNDKVTEAQVYANLGIAQINQGKFEEGASFFESQLNILDTLPQNHFVFNEKARALNEMGFCFTSLSLHEQAIKGYEKSLLIYNKLGMLKEQERLYRSIGFEYKALGRTEQSLAKFEKRLEIINLLSSAGSGISPPNELLRLKISCFTELGSEYLEVQQFDQAIGYFQQSLTLARERGDKGLELIALSLLGKSYQLMGDYPEAIRYFEQELTISKDVSELCMAKAFGNVGLVYESMGDLEQAMSYQEKYLNIISRTDDSISKATVYSNIGRLQHSLGNNIQAIAYLRLALQLVETHQMAKEEEAKIRHFLGLSLWRNGDLESAETQLEMSSRLLEEIRLIIDRRGNMDYSLVLFDRQIATYHALQRILIPMGKTDFAFYIAEKCRTVATSTFLRKLQNQSNLFSSNVFADTNSILQRIDKIGSPVLYFSIVGGFLFSWLIAPERGIIKFNESCINNEDDDEESEEVKCYSSMGSLLEGYIQGTREAIGIELNGLDLISSSNSVVDERENDLWSLHMEELGDKLNQESDKTGFLRMVSRNHRFNCSSYSLNSLFSLGSATGSVKSLNACGTGRAGSTRSRLQSLNSWQGPSSLRSLYSLLLAPFEEELNLLEKTCFKELVLVLDTDLFLVPFPILRMGPTEPYLCERFKLIVSPSISSIRSSSKPDRKSSATSSILIVGNPTLPKVICDQWGCWDDLPRAEREANLISELFHEIPLIGLNATKEKILGKLAGSDCIHLSTHVSWKLSAIVCSPPAYNNCTDEEDSPSISDFLLTAVEILRLRINAKLVVLSWCHEPEKPDCGVNTEGLVGLSKSLLAAGAHNVLISLWPVPEIASRLFFRTFYTSLLTGSSISTCLTEAMHCVKKNKNMRHPANWAGYLLIGSDANIVSLGQEERIRGGIRELLLTQERSRDALRVTLHLIEKSLQRIGNGQKNAMYTTLKSIENKVGHIHGWRAILISVGFRFEPASSNGFPAACFFPLCDPGEHLSKTSGKLQALLGLSPKAFYAFTKLLSHPQAGIQVISALRQTITGIETRELEADVVKIHVGLNIWEITGYHEFLISLGFELIEIREKVVILEVGDNLSLRTLHLALQASLAIFVSTEDSDELVHAGSFESLEFNTEEEALEGYMPLSPQPEFGNGAFTSYIRSRRGEPDGQNIPSNNDPMNNVLEDQLSLKYNEIISKMPPIVSPRRSYQISQQGNNSMSPQEQVSSGESCTNVWGNVNVVNSKPEEEKRDIKKKVILKEGSKLWNKMRNSMLPPPQPSTNTSTNHKIGNSSEEFVNNSNGSNMDSPHPSLISSQFSHLTRELPISDIYNERNVGLGIAPPLSKILFSNRLNLDKIEDVIESGNRSDNDAFDSLSAFDHLSIGADDSAPESKITYSSSASTISTATSKQSTYSKPNRMPPVPRKRTTALSVPPPLPNEGDASDGTQQRHSPGPMIGEQNDEKTIGERPPTNGTGSSSSCKNSPSEKKAVGTSNFTDSQFGSYSPSMAQNDLIQHSSASVIYLGKDRGERFPKNNIKQMIELHEKSNKIVEKRSQIPVSVNKQMLSVQEVQFDQGSSEC